MKMRMAPAVSWFEGIERMADAWAVKMLIAALGWLLFGDEVAHVAYAALFVLLALDLATGILKSRKMGTFDSRAGRIATVFKFVNVLIVFAAARMADVVVTAAVTGTNGAFMKAMIVYVAAHELKSIDENLVAARGIGLTAILRRFLPEKKE